jgi:hypothetical protein
VRKAAVLIAVVASAASWIPAQAEPGVRVDRLFGGYVSARRGQVGATNYAAALVEFIGRETIQMVGSAEDSRDVGLCVSVSWDYQDVGTGTTYVGHMTESGCVHDIAPTGSPPWRATAVIPTEVWRWDGPTSSSKVGESSVTVDAAWLDEPAADLCSVPGGGSNFSSGSDETMNVYTGGTDINTTGTISSAIAGDLVAQSTGCRIEGYHIRGASDAF